MISKPACKRLAVVLILLGAAVYCCWLSMLRMPLESYRGPWTPLEAPEQQVEHELRRHVKTLSATIGEHNVFMPKQYSAAGEYIESELGSKARRCAFDADRQRCFNFVLEIPGSTRAREIVVIGAHYDTVAGCPGANDNSSGTAALLVLADAFSNSTPARTVRFVAFANEEPPFFETSGMGSFVYAQECRRRGDNVVAMLSLETIGFYSEDAGSQKYPFPLGAFYPSQGNFIGFVGNTSSKKLVHECIAAFRKTTRFPSEGAALPGSVQGVGWSDHWSFWQAGYPAIMITDTAPFRYPHYHLPSDTHDRLVYDRMARVVNGLKKLIDRLATP